MRIYRVDLEVKTPTIVVDKSLKNWYTTVSKIVPSRTFYGGLISLLTSLGAEYTELFDKINTSSLYPLIIEDQGKDGKISRTYPAPPLTFKCKEVIKKDKEVQLFIWELASELKKSSTSIVNVVDSVYKRVCKMMNYCSIVIDIGISVKSCSLLESVAGTPIYYKDGKHYESKGFKIIALESVGINPITRSSEGGMVYTYEAISPGTMMHGFIAVENEVTRYIDKIKGAIMYLGRGTSRGYGLVEIKNIVDLTKSVMEEDKDVLIALSEVYPISGQEVLPTKIVKFISWSKLHGYMKPVIKVYSPGTLLFNFKAELEKLILERPGLDFFIPLGAYRRMLNGEI